MALFRIWCICEFRREQLLLLLYCILECADINLQKRYSNQTIYINSDSQAALLALDSKVITSRLVEDCLSRLNALGLLNRVILRWVPGHAGINGNECADELARFGAKGTQLGPEPFCGIPKSLAQRILLNSCFEESTKLWKNSSGMIHSKSLIKAFDKRFSNRILALSRNNLRILTRALTGHCRLNKHMFKLGLSDTQLCRLCEEADESPFHLLGECGALMQKRSLLLGKHLFVPDELRDITPQKILQFLAAAGLSGEL